MKPTIQNKDYFNVIDSYSKAYIAGFIAADGALVHSSNRNSLYLTITIKYEDKPILDFIKQELGSTHKITDIRKIGSFGKPIHHVRLAFAEKSITNALQIIGITPRKSLSMPNIIKNIPKQFRGAFIIGYFDGDGSVTELHNSLNCNSISIQIRGTVDFLKGITEELNIPDSYIHQHGSIPQLSITKREYQRRFFDFYEGLPFYYTRKYNKFLGHL